MRHTVARFDELEPGAAIKVEPGGTAIALVRIGDQVFAVNDICSHAHVSLSEGEVWCDEREIECPKHGSTFDLTTGAAQTLPATQPVAVYPVEIVDGDVVIDVPADVGPEGGAP